MIFREGDSSIWLFFTRLTAPLAGLFVCQNRFCVLSLWGSVGCILSKAQTFCRWSCVWANWNNVFFSSPKGTTECSRWSPCGLASLAAVNDSASDVKHRFPSEGGSKFDGELILGFLVSNGDFTEERGVISPVPSGKTNEEHLRNIIKKIPRDPRCLCLVATALCTEMLVWLENAPQVGGLAEVWLNPTRASSPVSFQWKQRLRKRSAMIWDGWRWRWFWGGSAVKLVLLLWDVKCCFSLFQQL